MEDAIKVEEGELATLRDPNKIRPIYITDFKNPFRQGKVLYIDQEAIEDFSSGVYSNSDKTSISSTSVSQANDNNEEKLQLIT